MILGAVVVAHDGGTARAKAHIDGNKHPCGVHDHAIGGDAVDGIVAHELVIIEHTRDRAGHAGHHFGCAVGAGLDHGTEFKFGFGKAKGRAVLFCEEPNGGDDAAHALAQTRRQRRACDSHGEERHKEEVSDHIGTARKDGDDQSELGLFCYDQIALEGILRQHGGVEEQDDATVDDAILDEGIGGAQKVRHGADEDDAKGRAKDADDDHQPDHHGEISACALGVALAECFGDQGASAHAKHGSHAA